MKKIPIVRSKLTIPQLPNAIIISTRIRRLVDAIYQKNAVTITAPSGYGKTTLLLSFLTPLKEKTNKICWYRIDEIDSTLSVFYTYLIETLFSSEAPSHPTIRQIMKQLAQDNIPYKDINALICQELWTYCSKYPDSQNFIILDDVQHLTNSLPIIETLNYFIGNLPNQFTLLLSSRQKLDFLSEKLKLEKNILEINEADLCFLKEEVAELLVSTGIIHPDEKLIDNILQSTEGWIAGIVMICQMLNAADLVQADSFLEKSWQKIKLFNYLTLEVLKTIDNELLHFLIKAATLEDFTIEEATEILNLPCVAQFVALCEKKGLFLQKIMREAVTYRFHSLFRDALLQLQHEYMTSEEIIYLNLKAATYYTDFKIFSKAIPHFIKGQDINSVSALIAQESIPAVTFEAIEQLRIWFNLIPLEVVEQSSSLLYSKGVAYQQGKDSQMIPLLEKAFIKFKEENNPLMQVYCLVTSTFYYMFTNKNNKLLDTVSEALFLLNAMTYPKSEAIAQVLCFAKLLYEEKFSEALKLSKALKNLKIDNEWKWLLILNDCMLGYLSGALDYSEQAIKEGFENPLAKNGDFFRTLAQTYYCTVLLLKNDTFTLMNTSNHIISIGEKYECPFMLGHTKRLLAYTHYAQYNFIKTSELLHQSTMHFRDYGNTIMPILNELCHLMWTSHQRNAKELLCNAKDAFSQLSKAQPGFCIHEISSSIYGAILSVCNAYKPAEKHLLHASESSEKKGAKQILCGTYFHLSKLYFDTNKEQKAVDYLNKALSLAFENKYSMLLDLHLPTLTEMCVRGIYLNIHRAYAKELLKHYFKKEAVFYLEQSISVPFNSPIGPFTQTFITKYYAGEISSFPCKIAICLLGEFYITVNNTPIPDDQWKTRKIKGILKYLIVHRHRFVTRYELMELFWPNSNEKSAAASLRVALYELRKMLAKQGVKNDDYVSFISEKPGSIQIKSSPLLSIDTDEFLDFYNQYTCIDKKDSDKKEKLLLLEKMNMLYLGDFLSADIYEDWTFADREILKSIFHRIIIDLASLYLEENKDISAEKLLLKALSIDPYNEEACLYLMTLYISKQQKNRAVKLYSDFEKRLLKDLQTKPHPNLSLYLKSLASTNEA